MPYIVLNNNELAHFKYIKREPDGHGGFRYYYDTGHQKNVTGAGKPIYVRQPAPNTRSVVRTNTPKQPLTEILPNGNTITNVSNGRPYPSTNPNQYAGWLVKNSTGVTTDMYKSAVKEKDNLNRLSRYGELDDRQKAELEYQSSRANAEGRNMAALKQEESRKKKAELEAKEAKKPANIAKSVVSSISTAAGSAFDKGKKWLSGIISTKNTVDYNPAPVGKINVVKGANGSLTAVGASRNKRK